MKSSTVRTILLLVTVFLVALIILSEWGVRFYFSRYGSTYEQVQYLATIEEVTADDGYLALPYINYMPMPNQHENNGQGFRGDEIAVPKEPGTFRIFALGSSSTHGWRVPSNEYTWPGQLQNILHEQYGYTNVEVVNAGVDGYTTHEGLVLLAFRLLELEPDMIVVYYGLTDMSSRMVHPDDYQGLNIRRGLVDTSPAPLQESALYRYVRVNFFGEDYDSRFSERVIPIAGVQTCMQDFVDDVFMCPNLDMTAVEVMESNPPIYFENNIRSIVAVAQAHDVQVLLSTLAYFPDEGNFGIINFMAAEFRQDAIAEHNAIVREIGSDFNVPVYDLFNHIEYNEAFWADGQHVNELGAQVQAQHYADFLVENGLLPDADN